MRRPIATLALALALIAVSARAQQLELTREPAGEHIDGYLKGDEVNYRDILGPPPPQGSLGDQIDIAEVQSLQTIAVPERFKVAEQDQLYLFPRFAEALGAPLDSARMPRTIALLKRALTDAVRVSGAGKTAFARIRPFQRLQLQRACGFAAPPAPKDNDPRDRTAYPSGHTTVGWTTALVLTEIAPGRGPAILARAQDYGLSRVICGAHWPSDVEAGRAVATAVVQRLNTVAAFREDVERARTEYAAAAGKACG